MDTFESVGAGPGHTAELLMLNPMDVSIRNAVVTLREYIPAEGPHFPIRFSA